MAKLAGSAWHVLTAQDTAQALRILRERKVDLLVIDLQMPVMDGLQFLALLHRRYPTIPKAILTGYASEPYRAACLSNGADLFLEKPTDANGWKNLYSVLNELVKFQPEEGFHGVLRKVGLHDILQIECLARSSSVLEITNPDAQGSIWVETGSIIHAQVGSLAGEEAFQRLLALSRGQFQVKAFSEPPARTISGPWEFLLMEAARKRDEELEAASQSAGQAVTVEPEEVRLEDLPSLFQMAPASPPPAVAPETIAASIDSPKPGLAPPRKVEAASPSPGPEPPPTRPYRPQIEEVMVCSNQGDVLYEWECPDTMARIRFLQFVSQKSSQLKQGLPLGQFDRLEIEGQEECIVTQITVEHALFVRSSRQPAQTNPSP